MVNVVKIGGNVIDDEGKLRGFLKDFSLLDGKKILVHGGGKEASRLSKTLGIEPVMIDGRRVTDRPTLDIVTMVYAGLINKRIVSILQEFGCDAIGLTGADGNVIPASRRSPEPIDYGFVGDIKPSTIDSRFIMSLMEIGKTPVFCAICHDGKGTLLNCNADSVASSVAIATSYMEPVRLTFCFEKPGVMADIDNPDSVIPLITSDSHEELLKKGIISGGMIPKVHNAMEAINSGVSEVRICMDSDLNLEKGTFIRK